MRRYFEFITAHPLLVLGVSGVIALALACCILLLTRDTSPDAFIPRDQEALVVKQRTDEEFHLSEPIAVCVIRDKPDGVFHPHALELIRSLTESIRELPGVRPDDVISLATESGVFFDEDRQPGFEPLMREVPRTPQALADLRRNVFGYELYRGALVAEDGSAATIIIRTRGDGTGDELYRSLEELVAAQSLEGERIVVAGEAAVRTHMGVAVSDDALRMNFACPLVMFLLIVLAYRTPRGTILPICVVGGASALALGSMALTQVPVYIVTNGIFVIIMALGVADSLHLVGQYYEEQLELRGRTARQVVVDACMALWFPLLVTSLTDVAGFVSLYLVGVMDPIRYFGLFAAVGVLGALIYSYTVVPAGLAILPLRTSRAFAHGKRATDAAAGGLDAIARLLDRVGARTHRQPWAVLAVWAVIIGLSSWGASHMVVNDARILAFGTDHPIVRATEEINKRFDGTTSLNIIVAAEYEGAFLQPEELQRIEALEAFTETLPYVGGTHSIAGWVKRAHQKMHDEDAAFWAIPEDPEETRFYLDVIGAPESPMAHMLREVIDPTRTRANLIVRMTSSEFVHQRDVITRLEKYLADEFGTGDLKAHLSGRANLDYHWLQLVSTSHVRSVLLSFGCVLVLTALLFRSVAAGLLCGLTVGIAVLVNYAIMGVAAIPLGVGTSMFASIAIGAGVDFPIHLLDRLRVSFAAGRGTSESIFRSALSLTGRAMFFTSMVVALGFLLLCVSEFRTLVRFGLLVGISMATSFVASVTLLPALVVVWKPRFVWGPRDRGAKPAA